MLRPFGILLSVTTLLAACSTTPIATDAAASEDSAPPRDTGADGSLPADASVDGPAADASDGSATCKDAPAGRLCVRGVVEGGSATEELTAGGKVLFQVFPKGCFSSSCTRVVEASCNVQSNATGVIALAGRFCLSSTGDTACTPDCSGGGFGNCEAAAVAGGAYTAKLGSLEVTFDVPSSLPPGGKCVGAQF